MMVLVQVIFQAFFHKKKKKMLKTFKCYILYHIIGPLFMWMYIALIIKLKMIYCRLDVNTMQ